MSAIPSAMQSPLTDTPRSIPHVHLRRPGATFQDLKQDNSALLREEVQRRQVVYTALPEVVTLNHTDLCNLRCVMCPRNLAQGTHRLSRRVLDHVADAFFPTARKAVLTTSGGEPLGADFEFLLEKALRFEVKMDIVTNGVLLTPELYRRLVPSLDHLNVSLDSHVPEVYERIRVGGSFAQVHQHLEAIRDLRAAQPDPVLYSLSAVVLRSNLPHLDDFVRHAATLGVDGVVFQRLRHEAKPTPEEEPTTAYSNDEIRRALEAACEAGRAVGVNVYLTEFGLPGVEVRPIRPKAPPSLEGMGLCWFLAQNFGVMYTGECYPCCIPTDHRLGNVLYEDPVRIWNGAPMRRLREAHLSGRGTAFCSGCLHAPHLAPRRPRLANEAVRRVRVAVAHVGNSVRRLLDQRLRREVFDPPLPAHDRHEVEWSPHAGVVRGERVGPANDVLTRHPSDGSLWFIRGGTLFRTAGPGAPVRTVCALHRVESPYATALRFVADDVLLAAFEETGSLERIELGGSRPRHRRVLELSDPRSFVRQSTLHTDGDRVWVGEYGIFPGARVANLYRSRDGGQSFQLVHRFREAKHVHLVSCLQHAGRMLVTTGDLAAERRLYLGRPGGTSFRVHLDAWSGFTAMAETDRHVHFGTDLNEGNGLVRMTRSLRGVPEFRAFPDRQDLQVRDLLALDGRRLLALLSADADLLDLRRGRRGTLLYSPDEGDTWSIAHEFDPDWSDTPEGLVQVGPREVVTVCTSRPWWFAVEGCSSD